MQQRISMVTLGVADTAASRQFYEALGWSGESPDGEIVIFPAAGIIIGLWDRDKLTADTAVTDSGGWGGITLAHYVNSRREVDEILSAATAAGGRTARPAGETSWGGYSGVFVDPDGHAWEVGYNPGWIVDSAGSFRPR